MHHQGREQEQRAGGHRHDLFGGGVEAGRIGEEAGRIGWVARRRPLPVRAG
jgi:hypothetical protein